MSCCSVSITTPTSKGAKFTFDTLTYSTVINAPIDEVWGQFRHFGKCPLPVEVAITNGMDDTKVGCNRRVSGGPKFVDETLIEHDDNARTLTYRLWDRPDPNDDKNLLPCAFRNLQGTVRFFEITATNQTLGVWVDTYEVTDPDAMRAALTDPEKGIFSGWFAMLGKQ